MNIKFDELAKGLLQSVRRRFYTPTFGVGLLVATLATNLAPGATFTSIDFPGAAFTTARGINSQGDIVGSYYTSYGKANIQYLPTGNAGHGFVLRAGTYTSIDFAGAILTEVWRITDGGRILGRYQSPAD